MVVGITGRTTLMAALMVSIAFAGCIGGGNNTAADIGSIVDLGNMTSEPEEVPFEWPECHLESGSITWPGFPGAPKPAEPVTVNLKTDAYGVTHIYADDLYSLFYANGYVQARDRLVQMDILRQVGYGESAKHLGNGQLALDESIHRTMYTREELQAQYDAAPAEAKQVLEAYSAGVNRWMAEAHANNQWPAEFAALSRVPPEWTPLDTVANINYLIGYFGVSGGYELDNLKRLSQLQNTLGETKAWDALEDWVPMRATDTYTSIHPDDLILNGCEDPLPRKEAEHQLVSLPHARTTMTVGNLESEGSSTGGVGGFKADGDREGSYFDEVDHGIMQGFKWGSNALVVDGSLTDTGKPIMWGAPQMGYYKPPVPYQVGLHAPAAGFDAVGIGVAGAPGIVIGRNAHIAWTATSGIEDQVDLVELPLTGSRSYEWDGVSKDMTCWEVEHEIVPSYGGNQGGPQTYTQEVCRAEGWPVVAINEQANVAYMQKTTTRNEELMGAFKWLQAPMATSIDEFRDLMSDFPFTFNYFVASNDGVAQIHTGNVPLRAPGYDSRLPAPAGAAYDWTGEAYTAQMGTWATEPSRGYIANWNNAPVYGWRTGDQYGLWGPVQRVQQIEYWLQEELQKDGTLSFEDVQAVNWASATHDSHALPFMPYLIEAAAAANMTDMHDALLSWFEAGVPWSDEDGDGFYDDPAHAIWDAMMQQLFTQITEDELGSITHKVRLEPGISENNADHGTLNNQMGPILRMLQGNTNHDWCDDIDTAEAESCQDQIIEGLIVVQDDLSDKFGSGIVGTWLEPVHTSKFLPLGAYAADERPMVNRGSYVQMVSMAEPARSVNVLPPGNSGLITSAELAIAVGGGGEPERLTGELDLYWTNQYKPFPLTEAEVDAIMTVSEDLTVFPL